MNKITKYYKRMPCMLGDIVGRIVGESDEGSWGIINGVDMYSIPLFATPHGTVFKTGVLRLSKITKIGMKKLSKYEKQIIDEGEELYNGILEQ